MNTLQARRLGYAFHQKNLFQPISFQLESGQGMVVRGANGIGKSTLFHVIAGLRTQYHGELLWNQHVIQPAEFRPGLLYIGHKPAVQMTFTIEEMLAYYGLLYGIKRLPDLTALLTPLGLEGMNDAPIHALSAGQRKKVSLLRLAMSPHRLCLLDEPFSHLDQASVQSIASLIQKQRQAGSIILLSCHGDHGLELPELSLSPC